VNELLEDLDHHVARFGVPRTPALAAFAGALEAIEPGDGLECSVKLGAEAIHAARFNLWFDRRDPARGLERTRDLFRAIEARCAVALDTRLVDRFFEAIDPGRLHKVIVGIDDRGPGKATRLKSWCILGEYPEKVALALALHGGGPEVRELLSPRGLLLGFDLPLGGPSSVKLYPDFTARDLADPAIERRVRAAFAPEVVALMEQCWWTHVGFHGSGSGRVLHFHPRSMDDFAALGDERARAVHDAYRGRRTVDRVLSVAESDLLAGPPFRKVTLYYLLDRWTRVARP